MVDKQQAIRDTLGMLTEELGITLGDSEAKKIEQYLSEKLVPEGTEKPPAKRTRVPKETVRAIRDEYETMVAEGRGSMTTLAKKYGVNVSTVQRYVSGTLRGGLAQR